MAFLLLIALMVVCLPVPWPGPVWDGDNRDALFASIALMTVVTLTAVWISLRTSRCLHLAIQPRENIAERYASARYAHSLLTLFGYAAMMLLLGWGRWVQQTCAVRIDGRWIVAPFAELVTILPFFLMQTLAWLAFYHADRAFYRLSVGGQLQHPYWTRWAYLVLHLRQQTVLILLPLMFLIIQQSILRIEPEWMEASWFRVMMFLIVPGMMLVLPLVTARLLGLKPLPTGPSRTRLETHAQRLGMRYRELMVWRTGNAVANAMLLGFLPRARYVVFTDRLLDELDRDEVAAVFGHEVGHARHRHFWTYMSFLILSSMTLSAGWTVAGEWLEANGSLLAQRYEGWILLPPVLFLGGYIFVVFGFLSRRCERQADLFGCKALSCRDANCVRHDESTPLAPRGESLCPTGIRTFIRAMQRVADLNGMARANESAAMNGFRRRWRALLGWLNAWQHWSLNRRIEYLESVLEDPTKESRFQRRLFILKCLLIALPMTILMAMVAEWGWDILTFSI